MSLRHDPGDRLALAFILGMAIAGYSVADNAERRVRVALAEKCVRESIGTDSAVEACYDSRDLPQPTEVQP